MKDKKCGHFNNSSHNKKYKHPCGVCQKSDNANQKAIFCNNCSLWYHRKCNGTSIKEYEMILNENDDIPWLCIMCSIDEMASKFPFGYQSRFELNDLYVIDLPSQLELLPSHELGSKLSQIPNLDDFDIEENYVQAINSKYYDSHEFNSLTASIAKCLLFFSFKYQKSVQILG